MLSQVPEKWRNRVLTAEEERELSRRIEEGAAAAERLGSGVGRPGDRRRAADGRLAREEFFEANIRLVLSIARRTPLPAGMERDDIVQDGMVGLDKAVEKFDWRKGFKFSTYATWWIRQGIQRGMEQHSTTIRVPAQRGRELRAALAASHGETGALPERLVDVHAATSVDSIDRPIGDGSDTLGSKVACPMATPDDAITAMARTDVVRGLLSDLDESTRWAIERRFGLDGEEPSTYVEIGAVLGITAEATRRRIGRALDRLRDSIDLELLAA